MEKRFIVFSLAFLFLLGGCGRYAQPDEVIGSEKAAVRDPVEGSGLTEIAIEENPSTGYLWQYSLEPEGIVEVAKDEYRHQGGPAADGAGGVHIWSLKGIKDGAATMTFICCREGNEEEISQQPVVYEISVDSDGRIALSAE